jgi:hypothetical protein
LHPLHGYGPNLFEPNISKVLDLIGPNDVVLDIGGWAQPLLRANYVMDMMPFETRGYYRNYGLLPALGDGNEFFTRDTWIRRDICSREPYPFEDKAVDFVFCSHTLEDIRDPLWVCSEMQRIGKRGYIEIPSRLAESIMDPNTGIVGLSHHRWLVTIQNDEIEFEAKYHLIHRKGLHLPAYFDIMMTPRDRVQWLFWEHSFRHREADIPLGDDDVAHRLGAFVQEYARPVPAMRRVHWSARRMHWRVRTALGRIRSRLVQRSYGSVPDLSDSVGNSDRQY